MQKGSIYFFTTISFEWHLCSFPNINPAITMVVSKLYFSFDPAITRIYWLYLIDKTKILQQSKAEIDQGLY